jgi:hypothetical protein
MEATEDGRQVLLTFDTRTEQALGKLKAGSAACAHIEWCRCYSPQFAKAASGPVGSSLILYTVCRVSPVHLATWPTLEDFPSIACAFELFAAIARLAALIGARVVICSIVRQEAKNKSCLAHLDRRSRWQGIVI